MTRDLLAGFACGSLMGILFVGLGTVNLLVQPAFANWLARLATDRISVVRASVLLALATIGVWTIVGTIFGMALFLLDKLSPGSGLGSPNTAYTLAVVLVSLGIIITAALLRREHIGLAIATALPLAAVFGWLLPWLAA